MKDGFDSTFYRDFYSPSPGQRTREGVPANQRSGGVKMILEYQSSGSELPIIGVRFGQLTRVQGKRSR